MEDIFDTKIPAVAQGTVEQICLRKGRSDCTLIYLKDCTLRFQNDPAKYHQNRLYVTLTDSCELHPGDRLGMHGILQKFQTARNPGMFDRRKFYKEKGIYYEYKTSSLDSLSTGPYGIDSKLQQLLYHIRGQMVQTYANCLPEKENGIITAMILGDKSLLDLNIQNLYQESGIGHLLAISGLHVTMIGMAFLKLLRKLSVPEKFSIFLSIFVIVCYGRMTDFSISTSRAIIMMILLLGSCLFERTYDGKNALALAAVIILLQKPFALFSCSFLLSFGAMTGIYVIMPVLEDIWYGDHWECKRRRRLFHQQERELKANYKSGVFLIFLHDLLINAGKMLLLSASIQLSSLPVVLYFFSEVPLYGILINLLIIPLASFLVIFSFLGGIAGSLYLPLGKGILANSYWLLKLYEKICLFFQKLPGHMQIIGKPEWWQLLLYYLILTGFLVWQWYCSNAIDQLEYAGMTGQLETMRQHRKFIGKLVPILCIPVLLHFPSSALQLTLLDVGQGDGIYIHTTDHKNILLDGGSTSEKQVGKYRLLPFLKSKGIRRLDYMIATHADEDHVNGLIELLQMSGDSYTIGMLLLPDVSDTNKDRYRLLRQEAYKKNIPVSNLSAGMHLQEGSVSFICLNPPSGTDYGSPNEESVVLSLQCQNFSCLLTGDLAGEGEEYVQNILKSPKLRRQYGLPDHYTVLKAAHHGSKNSTGDEFLSYVRPEYALISCGQKNSYGHPHRELLDRLQQCGSKIFRTDQQGAVMLELKNRKLTLTSYL